MNSGGRCLEKLTATSKIVAGPSICPATILRDRGRASPRRGPCISLFEDSYPESEVTAETTAELTDVCLVEYRNRVAVLAERHGDRDYRKVVKTLEKGQVTSG